MKTKTESLNIRIAPETLSQIEDLCKVWGLTKTAVIERLVYGEWCKSTEIGQAKIQEVMKQFGLLQKQVEALTNGR